ncbi:MAG: glycosyltransferase family 4 protein [Anaerolineae bacterium]|jgi:glycosyltransferase involved in cell wall biosynthesis
MKIAIDGRYIQDHYPGVGRYAYQVALALALGTEDRYVVPWDPTATNARFDLARLERCSNVTLSAVPFGPTHPRGHLPIARLLRQEGASVFWAPHWSAPWALPCPLVVTIHDLTPLVLSSEGARWRRRLYQWMVTRALRRAAGALVSSRATERDVQRLLAPAPPITVAPLGVGTDFAPRDEAACAPMLARLGIRTPFVLCVSVNRPHKNLPRLLKAWASLPAGDRERWQLVLAGAVDARWEDPIGVARRAGAESSVRRLGAVDEADLPALYAAAEVCIVPSLYEGFGLPALEAMAAGTPVAASNASALPEVIGDAGLLFDPADRGAMAGALAALMRDADLRQRLAVAGRERAATYTWERTAALVRQALGQAAGEVR